MRGAIRELSQQERDQDRGDMTREADKHETTRDGRDGTKLGGNADVTRVREMQVERDGGAMRPKKRNATSPTRAVQHHAISSRKLSRRETECRHEETGG